MAGDFNSEETETVLSEFLNSCDAENMVKENLLQKHYQLYMCRFIDLKKVLQICYNYSHGVIRFS